MKIEYPHYKLVQYEHRATVYQSFKVYYVSSETEEVDITSCISNIDLLAECGNIAKLIITVPLPVIEQAP